MLPQPFYLERVMTSSSNPVAAQVGDHQLGYQESNLGYKDFAALPLDHTPIVGFGNMRSIAIVLVPCFRFVLNPH